MKEISLEILEEKTHSEANKFNYKESKWTPYGHERKTKGKRDDMKGN